MVLRRHWIGARARSSCSGTRRSREALGCEAAGLCRDGTAPSTFEECAETSARSAGLAPQNPSLLFFGPIWTVNSVKRCESSFYWMLSRSFLHMHFVGSKMFSLYGFEKGPNLTKYFLNRMCDFDSIFYEFWENLCYIACFINSFSSR